MALNDINLLKVSKDLPEQDLNLFEVNTGWFQICDSFQEKWKPLKLVETS